MLLFKDKFEVLVLECFHFLLFSSGIYWGPILKGSFTMHVGIHWTPLCDYLCYTLRIDALRNPWVDYNSESYLTARFILKVKAEIVYLMVVQEQNWRYSVSNVCFHIKG